MWLLENNMKLNYFIKNGELLGWAYGGGANYEMDGCEKNVIEINGEDEKNLTKNTHEPYLDKGKIKFAKKMETIEKEIRKSLKQKENLTEEDIKQAIKLLL